jgi:hypothetical protein
MCFVPWSFRDAESGFRSGLLSPFARWRGGLVFDGWRRLVRNLRCGGSGSISPATLRGDPAAHFERDVVVERA